MSSIINWNCLATARSDVPYFMAIFNPAFQSQPLEVIFRTWWADVRGPQDQSWGYISLEQYAADLGCAQVTTPTPTPTPPGPGRVGGDATPIPPAKDSQWAAGVKWLQANPYIAIALGIGAFYFLVGRPGKVTFGSG